MANVGYSKTVAKAKPTEIIESEGVQSELSTLGFTEENAKAVTAQIMLNEKARDNDRLKAVELTFKVHGSFVPEQSKEVPAIINIFHNPNILQATQIYEASLKELITHATTQPVQEETQATSSPTGAEEA